MKKLWLQRSNREAPHRHEFVATAVSLGKDRLGGMTTVILQVCRGCQEPRDFVVNGHFQLEDFIAPEKDTDESFAKACGVKL